MSELKQYDFKVEGMSCGHCVRAIEKAVGQLPGVHKVNVDLTAKAVTVWVDGEGPDAKAIAAIVEDAGYQVVSGV